MERYLEIGKENLKHNVLLHVLVCVFLLAVSPLIMGVSNLEAVDTAKVLEMYVALVGIVLITPVFLPEQNKDLRDLVYAKYTPAASVYIIRVLQSLIIAGAMLGAYIFILDKNGCRMDAALYFWGTMAEIVFFGGLGLLVYGLSDSLVAGYLVPVCYYIMAVGSGEKYLKSFYPFSMSMGSYEEKIWLAAGGALMLVLGILMRSRRGRG